VGEDNQPWVVLLDKAGIGGSVTEGGTGDDRVTCLWRWIIQEHRAMLSGEDAAVVRAPLAPGLEDDGHASPVLVLKG
jgi:hypothetical protein